MIHTPFPDDELPDDIKNDPFIKLSFSVPRGSKRPIINFSKEEFLEVRIKKGEGEAEIPSRYLAAVSLILLRNKASNIKISESEIPLKNTSEVTI